MSADELLALAQRIVVAAEANDEDWLGWIADCSRLARGVLDVLPALTAERDRLQENVDAMGHAMAERLNAQIRRAEQAEAALEQARQALNRACYIAEHLLQMIDQETWRATGGDDGQGHYEGDYHAEKIADEIKTLARLGGDAQPSEPRCRRPRFPNGDPWPECGLPLPCPVHGAPEETT